MTADPRDVFISSLLIEGSNGLKAQLTQNLARAHQRKTADGVPTLELEVADSKLHLLRSNIMNSRITAQLDDQSYELVQTKKKGRTLTIVFEDLAVAEMRRHTDPRKFPPGTVTRVEAARALLAETPWIELAVGSNRQEKAKVELARGVLSAVPVDKAVETEQPKGSIFDGTASVTTEKKPKVRETTVADADREDTWTCLKRWFSEINWRCYVDRGVVNVGPDSAYVAGDPVYKLTDGTLGLTTDIDFDWDIGKPMATASYSAAVQRYDSPPGTCIELVDMGPASGKWFVSDTDRDLYTYVTNVKLKYPEPELPEPDPPPVSEADGSQDAGGLAFDFGALGLPSQGGGRAASGGAKWGYPLTGDNRVSSGFGPRRSPGNGGSSNHKGVDFAAATGRAIIASRAGTVTHAGPLGGYGNCVIVVHHEAAASGPYAAGQRPAARQTETRYAHMSAVGARRGVQVSQGQLLGLVGATGNTTGPHLHFEMCRGAGSGAVQVNPLPILMGVLDL